MRFFLKKDLEFIAPNEQKRKDVKDSRMYRVCTSKSIVQVCMYMYLSIHANTIDVLFPITKNSCRSCSFLNGRLLLLTAYN